MRTASRILARLSVLPLGMTAFALLINPHGSDDWGPCIIGVPLLFLAWVIRPASTH